MRSNLPSVASTLFRHPRWPAPRTPLVGRAPEIAALLDLLRDPDTRMVTITGPGGAGKTRLAVEIGRTLDAELADGATFVALAEVQDPALVPFAVVAALDVGDAPADEPVEQVRMALRHRHMLLVLDNIEQVVEVGLVVAELLDASTDLTVLATSRAPLHIRGEHVFRLLPLALPPMRASDGSHGMTPAPPDDLLAYPSVDLFCRLARAVRPGFELTDANADEVAAICRRVDGLPLAIELAAARSNVLPPAELLARLERDEPAGPLSVLSKGKHDLPPRQKGVRETVAWSYALLDPESQVLFRRLAVLHGTWTLETAEAVCGDPDVPARDAVQHLRSDAVLEGLGALVDIHLVEPEEPVDDGPRFVVLETIRSVARELLRDSGEQALLERRHAGAFAAFTEEAGHGLESPHERDWHERVDRNLPNVRAAYGWYRREGDFVAGLRLATALGPYWLHRGRSSEGRRWLEQCLAADTEFPRGLEANAQLWVARLTTEQGALAETDDARETIASMAAAMDVFVELDDRWGWLRAADHLSYALMLHEDTERAAEVNEEALQRCRAENERFWLAHFLQRAAMLASSQSQRERAGAFARETVAVAHATGHDRMEARGMQALALFTPDPDALEEVEAALLESLRLCEAARDRRGVATTLPNLGGVALLRGDIRRASAWFLRSILLARDMAYWHAQGFSLAGMVGTAAMGGEPEPATRLHGALAPHLAALRRGMPPLHYAVYEQLIEGLRASLGETRFAAVAAAGAEGSWEDALDEAVALSLRLAAGLDPLAGPSARPDETPTSSRRRDESRDTLTARETEVLRLIAAGLTNREIAEELVVSTKTVMHHSVHIYRKIGARGRAEATAYAYREGIVGSSVE